MIKSLKKRPRADVLKTEQRRATNHYGRMAYFGLLIAFMIAGINFLFGDFIFLRADGLVLREASTVSTTYLAKVKSVEVRPGDSVESGDLMIRLESMEVLERLADLSSRNASLAAKTAEFNVRSESISKLLPLAAKREKETAKAMALIDQLSGERLVTTARYDEALQARFEAQKQFVQYETEDRSLKEELATLRAARADAEAALADLRALYAAGIVRAPVTGAVGTTVPSPGDVYKPGETILSIYSGDSYVVAYLPRRYLFTIEPGQKVKVRSGRLSAEGVITKILSVSAALPEEFQNSFKPRDRNQLARIRLNGNPEFPLHAKVEVSMIGFPFGLAKARAAVGLD